MELATYLVLALAVFLIVLFLGVATFIRLVQVQRESMIYLTGMNRIRYLFQQSAPASGPCAGMAASPPRTASAVAFHDTAPGAGMVVVAMP